VAVIAPPAPNANKVRELARFQAVSPKPRYVGQRCLIGGNYTSIGTGGQAANNASRARQSVVTADDLGCLQVEWCNLILNAGAASTSGAAVTVTASIEYPSGTIAATLTFGGSASGTLPVSGTLLSDLVRIYIPAGARFWVRTFATVTAGQAIPTGFLPIITSPFVEYGANGVSGTLTDHTATATNASLNSATSTFGANAVHGFPLNPATGGVLLVTDSLGFGRGDSADGTNASPTGDGSGNMGPYQRALANAGIGMCKVCKSGQLARDVTTSVANRAWQDMIRGATSVIVQLGTNDLGTNVTFTTTQGYLMEIYSWCASHGVRVIPCTLPPRATDGTNSAVFTPSSLTNGFGATSWATSDLKALNDWIRTLPTLYPWVGGVIDGYSQVVSNNDPRLWKTNDSTTRWTTDGTHWSIANGTTTGGIEVVRDYTAGLISSGIIA
jgi:hypothetical protein